jgi:(5-formylfuran-3-yl)methyl phosphate synthase
MSKLVISVRSVDEVEPALRGGADLLDVKEPSRGSLGRANADVIQGIVRQAGGRVPVSAALGEWQERDPRAEEEILSLGLRFVKWGFTGYPDRLPLEAVERRPSLPTGTEMVLVCYGDWQSVNAPSPRTIIQSAFEHDFKVILFDTFTKDGSSILRHLDFAELSEFVSAARSRGIEAVLAGSLTAESIRDLKPLQPAWFAVRGAACGDGDRKGMIDENRVRELKRIV